MAEARVETVTQLYGIYIYSKFKQSFVDDLKRFIPGSWREWDGVEKRWYVAQSYAEEAVRIVRSHYNDVDLSKYQTPEKEYAYGQTRTRISWERRRVDDRFTKRAQYDDGTYGPWVTDEEAQREYAERAYGERSYQEESNGAGYARYHEAGRNQRRNREQAEDDFNDFFRRYGGQRTNGQQRQQRQAPPPPIWNIGGSASDYDVLYVKSDAPAEVIRAAYKALALLYHPDKGGDTAKMQKVNTAFDNLKKAGKA